MEAEFKRFLEPLRGRTIDLAMVPLDPRQASAAGWGLRYLLELADVRRVLPMHQWGDFALTRRFLAEFPAFSRQVAPVEQNGQSFVFP